MDQGWIKIHRKLYDNPYASDPHWVALWIYFLCRASRGGRQVLWKGKRYTLKPGQFTAGYNQMAKETGINREKIRRVVALFKSDTQITHQTSSACSLFTVLNWSEYQTVTPNLTLKRHSSDTQVTPKQEVEKERIEEEVVEGGILTFKCDGTKSTWELSQKHLDQFADAYPSIDILAECKKANAWLIANPDRRKTARGMSRFLNNWISRAQDSGRGQRKEAPTQAQTKSKPTEGTWSINTQLTAVNDRIRQLKSKSPGDHCDLYDFLNEAERNELGQLGRKKRELETKLTQL